MTHTHKAQVQNSLSVFIQTFSYCAVNNRGVGVHAHVHKHYTSPFYARWLIQTCIISRRFSITKEFSSRTHWHLYARILGPRSLSVFSRTRGSGRVQKSPSSQSHTHAERAVLRCSIRLSMAIILISAKGKSLLWAAGGWGESRISVTHSNTKRQPATADRLFMKHFY